MLPTPDQFASTSVGTLLEAAARGLIGVDHRFLHAILDRGEAAVPELLSFALEREHDSAFDNDLLAIFRYLRPPRAMEFYVACARRQSGDFSDNLTLALIEAGPAAVEPMLQLCSEIEEEECGEPVFVLAGLGVHDDRIRDLLLDRLEYDASEGALLLGMYGDPVAKPALTAMLEEVDDDFLKIRLQQVIREIDEPIVRTTDPYNIWDEYPAREEPNFSALSEAELIELLSSDPPEYRKEAASRLSREYKEAGRKALVGRAHEDADPAVRGACWEALAGDVSDHGEIRNAMIARATQANTPVEELGGLLVALSDHLDDSPIRGRVEALYQLGGFARQKALEAMRHSWNRRFAPYFPPHLDDPDPDILREAIWGVGFLAIHDSAEKLKRFFDDPDLRLDALYSYALGVRAEISRGRIHALYRKIRQSAGGLDEEDELVVRGALDRRLELHGHAPVFGVSEQEHTAGQLPAPPPKLGRNDPCPCGSGRKYKKCCGK